jgi:hypothetical protein
MSQDVSFRRKIIYVAAIALLLFPLFLLGQPATTTTSGGVLAQLRTEYNLGQSDLGEIDPASEAMKLATMGLRPVAVITLWEKANEYKMKEDWDNLSATLNQIIKLQPNFISVWEFQAHNLSYNVSVEFDDYRQRYHWVKRGINFLTDGIRYNRENPRLLHQIGWIMGQKFGRADEYVQFRQIFREDDDFHREINEQVVVDDALGYDGRPDQWLVGRLWYQRAQSAVDTLGIPLAGKSPLIFHASNPMSLINYASAIEEEGVLGETAMRAWREGQQGWAEYGERQIPTSWGHNVRLADYERIRDDAAQMVQALDEMLPGLREQIEQEKRAQLTPEQREALDTPEEELTEEIFEAWAEAKRETFVSHRDVAERAEDRQVRERARRLAGRIEDAQTLADRTHQYRGTVNYEYWLVRSEAEQTPAALEARENLYHARRRLDEASLEDARELYETSWKHWRDLYDQYPRLMDAVEADDVLRAIRRYGGLLQQLDEPLPEDFPLYDFLRRFRDRHDDSLDDFLRQALQQHDAAQRSAPKVTDEQPEPEQPAAEETNEPEGMDDAVIEEPENQQPAETH